MSQPSGVLLVGSVPLKNEEDVFSKACKEMPNRLIAVPDGETGSRKDFVIWQKDMLPPQAYHLFVNPEPAVDESVKFTLDDIKPTQYETVAAESYKTFCRLRDEGVIQPGVRFQVCFPGVLSVAYPVVHSKYRAQIVPLYEQRLLESVRRVQELIPAHDLAIQFDISLEYALLENSRGNLPDQLPWSSCKAYWSAKEDEVYQYIVDTIVRSARAVRPEILLGFHHCYGDLGHKHFVEPADLGLCVDMTNDLVRKLKPAGRAVNWSHVPCPPDRTDEAYYRPLNRLELEPHAKIYLGLVREHDREGTLQRVRAAQKAYPGAFGVGTECGMGRTPPGDIDSIFEISAAVSAPVATLN